ncbi:MAG: PAS domain-containing protein, partial [Proteobacteria bacterium]|nr:PAS domain-containing protein [Pseudomonadota bacterium]
MQLPPTRPTIIAVGASAGGLEAFIKLVKKIKLSEQACVVFSQHLDPSHPSLSPEIISKSVRLEVVEIRNRMKIEPGCIYIQPSNTILKISKKTFGLTPRTKRSQTHIIDLFFESVAQARHANLIGILLTGHGKDGALGLKTIKEQGGVTFVQDPASADSKEMPRNAILLKAADYVLPLSEIARTVNKALTGKLKTPVVVAKKPIDQQVIAEILGIVKRDLHVDFTLYKPSTIIRRIQRRMNVNKTATFSKYLEYLKVTPEESKLFYDDILIHVTTFFRDPKAFDRLKEDVFPEILKNKKTNQPLRIWVAGCSTGEEAYSLAMLLTEFLHEQKAQNTFQIFATDISEVSIQFARTGIYPASIKKNITAERLKKYFEVHQDSFKITKHLRDQCLFSLHDMTADPPFGKLDLISCRNVMIYFSSELQKKIIPLFHFSLAPKGYLWLGRSEAPAGFLKLFGVQDQEARLYFKKDTPSNIRFSFPPKLELKEERTVQSKKSTINPMASQELVDKIILNHYSLPGVVITPDLEVVEYRGRCSPFLEPSLGQPSHNILKLAHHDIQPGLRLILKKALTSTSMVQRSAIALFEANQHWLVDIEVTPLPPQAIPAEKKFLVIFRSHQIKRTTGKAHASDAISREDLRILMSDLADAKESHRVLLEDYEHGQEEITSANEELQSANEELQSTNEELETAKEELQSTNEELTTVNEELQIRNGELTTVGSDLTNLLASSEIPIMMVDSLGKIKRFTPEAKRAFNIHSSDIGKNIKDINFNFSVDLPQKIKKVEDSHLPKKLEVQDHAGLWKQLQIRPYKTLDDKIDGVSITLVDIDQIKQKENYFKESLDYIKSVADTVPLPFVVIGADYQLKSANQAFYDFFKITRSTVESDFFSVLELPLPHRQKLEEMITANIIKNRSFTDYELHTRFDSIGERRLLLSGGKVQWVGDEPEAVLVSFIDITERSRLENELNSLLIREREARNEAEKANRAKDVFLATLSHELRTPLSAILTWSQLIGHKRVDAAMTKQGAAVIEQSAKAQSQLIDDLLDISRIISGKLALTIK